MAIRIPVVISQHERRLGSIADYEEQLITRIVMESGLDATLIADLKSIELDTTDHLCLEGLKGDFALATWESSHYVCTHLHRLGIPSVEIIPVDGSPKIQSGVASLQPSKKIFLITLATSTSVDITIKTLKDLLLARSTPVFSIGAPISRNKSLLTVPGPTVKSPQQTPSPITHSSQVDSAVSIPKNAPKLNKIAVSADGEFPNIDLLMDELDQFEI